MTPYASLIVAAALLAAAPVLATPATYEVNSDHTDVMFEIGHLGFSMKHGSFRTVSGTLSLDPDAPAASMVDVKIATNSIDTNLARRDHELMGPGFLDAVAFPEIHYVSSKVTLTGKDTADIDGVLTLHGVSRPVVLHARLNKLGVNPLDRRPTVGFSASAALKRSDFGVKSFLPMIADDVAVTIDMEFSGPRP